MGRSHKFRFGVQCSAAASATAWREQARKMEDLGYSTLFMPDHFADTDLAPMVGMSVAAAATTTLRIGSLVLDNDYKHPAVVAKEAATLDLLWTGASSSVSAPDGRSVTMTSSEFRTTAPACASTGSRRRSR